MVQTADERVADHYTVKAALLDILYSQPGHCSRWRNLYRDAVARCSAINEGRLFGLINDVMVTLMDTGQIVGKGTGWYQLTLNGWLAMTRSRQLCSTISTSSPIIAQPGKMSMRS